MTKDSRSWIHSKVQGSSLPVSVPPLAEAFDAVQISVNRFCLLAGIEVLQELMADDVASLCGPMHRHDAERKAYRWGTTVAQIYKKTGNLRAVQLLLGHTKVDSTVRYLGVDLEDALEISEGVEI